MKEIGKSLKGIYGGQSNVYAIDLCSRCEHSKNWKGLQPLHEQGYFTGRCQISAPAVNDVAKTNSKKTFFNCFKEVLLDPAFTPSCFGREGFDKILRRIRFAALFLANSGAPSLR